MSFNSIFSNIFEIQEIDPHGKKFDRVSRISASSDSVDMELTLDVNTEIYPLQATERITLVLATLSGNYPCFDR
jgi:DNA-directed RNA polymerases I, II, and III subunit RPABC3